MNKPEATETLLPIREYAKTRLSRRGMPVSVQYVYTLIKQHKEGLRELDFEYVEIDKQIWVIKSK